MKRNDLVTVIITTYKRNPEVVCRAVKSVCEQSYKELEIIIVDDSPKEFEYRDLVYQKIQEMSDDRIYYLKNEKNMGACASRNRAITIANGEFIIYVDDDDEILETCIEKRVNKFTDDRIGLVYSDCYILNELTGEQKRSFQEKHRGMSFDSLILNNYIYAFPMVRKCCYKECGMFDVQMPAAQDYEMWLRIAKKYKIDYVDEPLAIVHLHAGERISTNIQKKLRGLELLNEINAEYLNINRHANHVRTLKLCPFYADARQWKKCFRSLIKGVCLEPWDLKFNMKQMWAVAKSVVSR